MKVVRFDFIQIRQILHNQNIVFCQNMVNWKFWICAQIYAWRVNPNHIDFLWYQILCGRNWQTRILGKVKFLIEIFLPTSIENDSWVILNFTIFLFKVLNVCFWNRPIWVFTNSDQNCFIYESFRGNLMNFFSIFDKMKWSINMSSSMSAKKK